MKRKIVLTAALAITLAVIGCTSFNSAVFYSEKMAADLGTGAVHSFNVWYGQQTNGANAAKLADLNSLKAQVYTNSYRLGKSLEVTEALRQTYATNSASSNKIALQMALEASQSQATNMANSVQLIIGK